MNHKRLVVAITFAAACLFFTNFIADSQSTDMVQLEQKVAKLEKENAELVQKVARLEKEKLELTDLLSEQNKILIAMAKTKKVTKTIWNEFLTEVKDLNVRIDKKIKEMEKKKKKKN